MKLNNGDKMNSIRSIDNHIRVVKRISLITCLLLFVSVLNIQAGDKPVILPGTQIVNFSSKITGEEFDLCISLPRYYDDTAKTFPVLYVLDAQWDFPLVYSLYGQQYYDGQVPGLIIVGIRWGGSNPNYDSLRAGDLTPSKVMQIPQSGKAANFLKFIKEELIPYIDDNYRTNKKDRALAGSSYGGLFTLYTMFNETETFNGYLLTSPAIAYDNQIIYKVEKRFFESKKPINAKVYMAVGGYENAGQFEEFVNLIKSRNYEGLQIDSKILDGIGHSGSKAEGYTRGLQYVFALPDIKVPEEILNTYAGNYLVNNFMPVTVLVEEGILKAIGPDKNKVALFAQSADSFYLKGQYFFLHVVKNESGEVTGFNVNTFGDKFFAKKIK